MSGAVRSKWALLNLVTEVLITDIIRWSSAALSPRFWSTLGLHVLIYAGA